MCKECLDTDEVGLLRASVESVIHEQQKQIKNQNDMMKEQHDMKKEQHEMAKIQKNHDKKFIYTQRLIYASIVIGIVVEIISNWKG